MQTILVCDDDKQIVEAIDIYLTGEGFKVIKAYDGYEALEYLPDQTAASLGLTGEEEFTVHMPAAPRVRERVQVTAEKPDGTKLSFEAVARFDSEADIRYYQNDGILPMILKEKSASR